MKNHMKSKFTIFILFQFLTSCLYSNTLSSDTLLKEKDFNFDTIKVIILKNKIYKGFEFKIIDLEDIENSYRKIILKHNDIEYNLCLLNQDDFNGFAIDWIKENKQGFEISIEYGSRIYKNKNFYFVFKNNNFYLNKIKLSEFDKFYPEKFKYKTIKFNKQIQFNEFNMLDYIN